MNHRLILRRVLAALMLLAFAVGSVRFWNRGSFDTAPIATSFPTFMTLLEEAAS
ncbi:MAG: hypothetical protein AAF291_15535 [Pseudomonadota bacterium]